MKQWTDEEKIKLKHLRLVERKSIKEIGVILNRTEMAVNNMLSEMKVKKPRKKDLETPKRPIGCGYNKFPDSIRQLLGFPEYDETFNLNRSR